MNSNIKELLKKIIPHTIINVIKKKHKILTLEDVEQVNSKSRNGNNLELLKKISLKISTQDGMYKKNGARYLQVGLSAISCIEEAIKKSEVKSIEKVLDMPCGHGRVLRFIAKYFPKAELIACDINRDGVDFCNKEFGATPLYSSPNLKEFSLDRKVDLIWCGSLATHFDRNDTTELLNFFYRHLNSGALLVFSMHGTRTINNLNTGEYTYGLSSESRKKLLLELKETGYGYVDYQGQSKYGISTATREWMEAKLNEVGKWRNFNFSESAWDEHHDIYSVVKL